MSHQQEPWQPTPGASGQESYHQSASYQQQQPPPDVQYDGQHGWQDPYAQSAYPQDPYAQQHNPYASGPPPGWGVPPGMPYPPAWGGYVAREHPSAQTAMVLGLISIIGGFVCGAPLLLGPVAWYLGAKVRREVAESQGQLQGRDGATTGMACGIASSVLLALGAVVLVLIFGVAAVGSTA